MNLVRGKNFVKVRDLDNRFVEKLQNISLSEDPVESEAFFGSKPNGASFSSHNMPHGPSALIERFDVGNARWDHSLEKVYYDTDLVAGEAVCGLHERNVPFSSIQKAFSTGTMGVGRRRCLVPTRWSITACDSTLGNSMLSEVRHYDILDTFRIHEFSSLNNYYAVLLMPTFWQYEWMEAFIHVLGREEFIFSDHEHNTGKGGYSCVGGCYYSCKMAVLEALAMERTQAGAIIFREAYPGYVPLGVFNVRENVRNAMRQEGREFEDMGTALAYINGKTHLPVTRFIKQSSLLRELLTSRQTTLAGFT